MDERKTGSGVSGLDALPTGAWCSRAEPDVWPIGLSMPFNPDLAHHCLRPEKDVSGRPFQSRISQSVLGEELLARGGMTVEAMLGAVG